MITHTARRPHDSFDWLADDDWQALAERLAAERERFEGLPGKFETVERPELPDQTSTHDMQPAGEHPIEWELAQNPRRWVPVYYTACKRCRAGKHGAKLETCPHAVTLASEWARIGYLVREWRDYLSGGGYER